MITQNEARETLGYEPDPDGDRYYPGTGSPEEIERQEEQAAQRADAMNNMPDEAKGMGWWLHEKYNHFHDPRTGRFISGGGRGSGATGSASPLSARPGGPPPKKPSGGGGGGGGKPSGNGTATAVKPAPTGKHAVGTDMSGKSEKEIAAHGKEMSAGWRNGLSTSEHTMLRSIYSGESFGPINNQLRDPKTAKASEKSPIIKTMDGALSKASLKEDTIVYRGIKDPAKLGLHPDKAIGAQIVDKGFMSTSIDPKVAHKYAGDGAVLKISAPRGAKGASLSGVSRYPKEHEVLFARGSGYKITGVSREGGKTVYHAELVQP